MAGWIEFGVLTVWGFLLWFLLAGGLSVRGGVCGGVVGRFVGAVGVAQLPGCLGYALFGWCSMVVGFLISLGLRCG